MRPIGTGSPPGETAFTETIPVFGVPFTAGLDGAASGREPEGLNVSSIARSPAFTAPRSGSCTYMIRQVTPAANAEIAIGMKTTVLNATDHRTRSVSTPKMRPSAVTKAGTTASQIMLFLIAVTRTSVVKSVL